MTGQLLKTIRRPDVTFCRNGRINITARVARSLQLTDGDAINIFSDGIEFLLFVQTKASSRIGRDYAVIHPSNKGSNHFVCNCIKLSTALLNAIGSKDEQVSFFTGEPIEIHGKTYIPIITSNPCS